MRSYLAWLKQHSAAVAMAVSAMVLAAGAVLLVLATRPSRFVIEPGQCLQYRLVTESAEILDDGSERAVRSEICDLLLVCTSVGNQAAFVAVDQRQARTALVEIGDNGAVRTTDAAGRRDEGGVTQGWFDFSLCVLPPGNEQAWTADVVYAALPAHRRFIQAKIRRTRSGSSPEFQLKLPDTSVEWINAAGRYENIRKVSCTYRFSNHKQAVQTAELRLVSAVERRDEGQQRFRWRIMLNLVSTSTIDDQPKMVRDLALTGAALEEAVASGQRERANSLAKRLSGLDLDDARLRDLVRRLIERARLSPPALTRSSWAVQVVAMPLAQKLDAERMARQLAKQGFKAYVAPRPGGIAVMVGPFDARDSTLIGKLMAKVPLSRPSWIPVSRE